MPLESNGVGINSRRLPAESVVSAFQHITYATRLVRWDVWFVQYDEKQPKSNAYLGSNNRNLI